MDKETMASWPIGMEVAVRWTQKRWRQGKVVGYTVKKIKVVFPDFPYRFSAGPEKLSRIEHNDPDVERKQFEEDGQR